MSHVLIAASAPCPMLAFGNIDHAGRVTPVKLSSAQSRMYWHRLGQSLAPGIAVTDGDTPPDVAVSESQLDYTLTPLSGGGGLCYCRARLDEAPDSTNDPALWARAGAFDDDGNYRQTVEQEIAADTQPVIDYQMRYSMQFGRWGRLMAAARFATPRDSKDYTVLDPERDLPPQVAGQITAVRFPFSRLNVTDQRPISSTVVEWITNDSIPVVCEPAHIIDHYHVDNTPLPADGTIIQERARPTDRLNTGPKPHDPVNYTSALPHDDTHPSAHRLPYGPLSAMLRRLAERIEVLEHCGS